MLRKCASRIFATKTCNAIGSAAGAPGRGPERLIHNFNCQGQYKYLRKNIQMIRRITYCSVKLRMTIVPQAAQEKGGWGVAPSPTVSMPPLTIPLFFTRHLNCDRILPVEVHFMEINLTRVSLRVPGRLDEQSSQALHLRPAPLP